MTIDPRRALADAWALCKREHTLLLPIAGLFLFVPQLAALLLLPPTPALPVERTAETLSAWFEGAYSPWASAYGPWLVLGYIVALFGSAAILALFLSGDRLDVRGALRAALRLSPRFILASFLAGLPVGIGYLLILPGIYLLGRLMLTGPAVMAVPGLGAAKAVARSWRLTRGAGVATTMLAALAMLSSAVIPAPFQALSAAMQAADAVNPVALAVLEVFAAAAVSAAALALLLIEVAVWRQIGASRP